MADDDNFFSRWSRRKVQKQAGEWVAETPAARPPVAVPTAAPTAAPVGTAAAPAVVPAPADGSQGEPPAAAQEKTPPPTLEDVARLTKDSDFSRFVGKDVSPDVRNAAMKKLFADPHFNVMDGLDIYIDDYSIPSPMSKDFARTLASAKFMKLFDEPEQTQPPAGPSGPTNRAEAASPDPEPTRPEPQPQPATDHMARPDTAPDTTPNTAPDTPTSSSAP